MVEQSVIQQADGGSNPTPPLQTIYLSDGNYIPDLYLEFCSREDSRYQKIRDKHYVLNKGVHAQQVHFLIWYKSQIVGIISGGSAVYATPARDKFFQLNKENREKALNGIINNIVFRLIISEPNLATRVLSLWRKVSAVVWEYIYQITIFGYESLIIQDRTNIPEGDILNAPIGVYKNSPGTLYLADNWVYAGDTEGNTKEHDIEGLNKAFGRVQTTVKIVVCKWREGYSAPIVSNYTPTWQSSAQWMIQDPEKKGDKKALKIENTDLIRRLKKYYKDVEVTQEWWNSYRAQLKIKAKAMSGRRKEYLGKKFFIIGRKVYCL